MQGPYPARPTHPAPQSANPPLPSAGHAAHCAPGWEREKKVLKANWDGVSLSAGCHGNERVGVEGLLPEPLESKESSGWSQIPPALPPSAAHVATQPSRGRGRGAGGAGPIASLALLGTAAVHSLLAGWCSLKAWQATVPPSRPGGHSDHLPRSLGGGGDSAKSRGWGGQHRVGPPEFQAGHPVSSGGCLQNTHQGGWQ